MPAKSRTHNYLRGLASGYMVTFATIAVGLWLTPFTLRFLDREQFAVFTLASDVLMWIGLLELGFTSVLNVRAAQISGKPNQAELNTLVSTTFFAQISIALVIIIAGTIVSLFFPDFFVLRDDLRSDAVGVMALMTLGLGISVATQTFSALLVAHQQMYVDNLLRLGLIFIRTSLTVWMLMSGYGLLSLAWANLAATVITSFLAVCRVRKFLPGLSVGLRYFSWDVLLRTGGVGVWFSLGGLAGILILNLDRIVTAKIISVEMVTTLSLTGRVYVLAGKLIEQVTNTARPALAQIIGQGKFDHALVKFHQLVGLSTGLAITAAAGLWAGNGEFVSWWVGPQNYGGPTLDAFLAVNMIVHAWVLPSRAMLVASMAYIPQNAISRFVEGILNISLSIVLGLRFGITGVVAATAISGVLVSCWYFPWLAARFFKVKFFQMHLEDMAKMVLLGVVVALLAYLCRYAGSIIGGVSGILTAGSLCVIGGSLCCWLFVLDDYTKEMLKNMWQRVVSLR